MATGTDQAAGYAMMTLAGAIFSYYTLWVIVLPFVDADHMLQQYFPTRVYAVMIPIVAGVVALTCLLSFIAFITLKSKKTKLKTN